MSETAYIDELLKAQKEASEIIENAQKERQISFYSSLEQRKLKEAREAAEKEVSKYRQSKEMEFEKLKERKQDKEFESSLEAETKIEIARIQEDFNRNKQKVVDMLVNKVLEVDLTIPNSIKEKFIKK